MPRHFVPCTINTYVHTASGIASVCEPKHHIHVWVLYSVRVRTVSSTDTKWNNLPGIRVLCNYVLEHSSGAKSAYSRGTKSTRSTNNYSYYVYNTAVVVVFTVTHRYNAVRGHGTGSNNSGAEDSLRRKTNKLTLTMTDCGRAASGSSSKIMLRTLRRFLAMQLEHQTLRHPSFLKPSSHCYGGSR